MPESGDAMASAVLSKALTDAAPLASPAVTFSEDENRDIPNADLENQKSEDVVKGTLLEVLGRALDVVLILLSIEGRGPWKQILCSFVQLKRGQMAFIAFLWFAGLVGILVVVVVAHFEQKGAF